MKAARPLQKVSYGNRIAFWTLLIVGFLLVLSGWEPAAYGYGDTHPFVVLGVPMFVLGFAMILCSTGKGIFKRQTPLIVGLCGLFLVGIVAFVIPFLPYLPFSPFNFHTYSIILGWLGIACSLECIAILANRKKSFIYQV